MFAQVDEILAVVPLAFFEQLEVVVLRHLEIHNTMKATLTESYHTIDTMGFPRSLDDLLQVPNYLDVKYHISYHVNNLEMNFY